MPGIRTKVNINDLLKFQRNLAKLNPAAREKFTTDTLKELTARLLAKAIKRTQPGVKPADLKQLKKAMAVLKKPQDRQPKVTIQLSLNTVEVKFRLSNQKDHRKYQP